MIFYIFFLFLFPFHTDRRLILVRGKSTTRGSTGWYDRVGLRWQIHQVGSSLPWTFTRAFILVVNSRENAVALDHCRVGLGPSIAFDERTRSRAVGSHRKGHRSTEAVDRGDRVLRKTSDGLAVKTVHQREALRNQLHLPAQSAG